MVWVPGGTFRMGSDSHYPEEAPAHRVAVDGFWIDRHPVTNERFARFVAETGHVTFAEIAPNPADYPGAFPNMLHPGSLVFRSPAGRVDLRRFANWWELLPWRRLASSGWPGNDSRAGLASTSRRPRRVYRRRGVRDVGRQVAADRGRVGVCGPRWTRRRDVRLG